MKKCIWTIVAAMLVTGVAQADSNTKRRSMLERPAGVENYGTTAAAPACVDFPIATGFEADCSTNGTGDDGWAVGWGCGNFVGIVDGCSVPVPGVCPGHNCCVDDPNDQSGWYLSASSQQCTQPQILTTNPYAGEQHIRFSQEVAIGCTGFTGPCRITAFSPIEDPSTAVLGPVTMSLQVAGSAYGGSDFEWWTQTSVEGLRTTRTMLSWYGTILIQDDGSPDESGTDTGVYWTAGGAYAEWKVEIDPCQDFIKYYYGGVQYWQSPIWAGSLVDAFFFMTDNFDTDFDVDDLAVTRFGKCVTTCGNGIVEPGEECEDAAICGAGTCVANNGGDCVNDVCVGGLHDGEACVYYMDCDDPADCVCDRACAEEFDNADPACELDNGANTFTTFGGWAWFTADTPFTAVDLCGSTGNDTFLMMYWIDDAEVNAWQVAYNDDCSWWDPYGMMDPLASCYYPYISSDWYESCTCLWTTPGDIYTVNTSFFGDVPPGHTTVINIEKRMDCGAHFVTGACCDPDGLSCEDFVAEEDCKAGFWTQSKLCAFITCEPTAMACCDTTPGQGGVCTDGVLPADCDGPQAYHGWPDCASIVCSEMTGACCDHAPGFQGLCVNDVLVGDCQGAQLSWHKDELCIDIDCSEAVGACCNSDAGPLATTGLCEDGLLSSECDCEACVWSKGALCSEVTCDADFIAIPTMNEWGLVILTLLLLAGTKIYFSRREATA